MFLLFGARYKPYNLSLFLKICPIFLRDLNLKSYIFPSSLCVNPDFQLVSVLYFPEDSFNISCNVADEVFKHFYVSVQFSLCLLWFFATPWIAACQASLSIPNSRSLLKLMSINPTMSCHPTISSSVMPFSSCLQSFPVSGSFLMCQFFASGGQSTIGASASASVLPVNIQD